MKRIRVLSVLFFVTFAVFAHPVNAQYVSYKLPFIPVTVSYDADGFHIGFEPSVTTPFGTLSAGIMASIGRPSNSFSAQPYAPSPPLGSIILVVDGQVRSRRSLRSIPNYKVKAGPGLRLIAVYANGDDLIVDATTRNPELQAMQRSRDSYRQRYNEEEVVASRQEQQIRQLRAQDTGHVQDIRTAWSSAHGWKEQAMSYREQRDEWERRAVSSSQERDMAIAERDEAYRQRDRAVAQRDEAYRARNPYAQEYRLSSYSQPTQQIDSYTDHGYRIRDVGAGYNYYSSYFPSRRSSQSGSYGEIRGHYVVVKHHFINVYGDDVVRWERRFVPDVPSVEDTSRTYNSYNTP